MTFAVNDVASGPQGARNVLETEPPALAKAATLLENLRRTPMRRGRLDERRRMLRGNIETTLEAQRILPRLATRIALQLVLKFRPSDLGDQRIWRALGVILKNEMVQLQRGLRLTDRLITVGLPKLSADEIERLFQELRTIDATYGRTLAEAALDGADPRAMGQRYGRAFKTALNQLATSDPSIARTLAAAAFRSRHPVSNALAYLRRFHSLVNEFQGNYAFARTVARAAFIAPDPIRAARQFVRDYQRVVSELTLKGLEPTIARTLASIASFRAEPLATAYKLLDNFRRVEAWVKQTHPLAARSVALAACRASDPLTMASAYVANYDRIMEVIGAVDRRRARKIANQAFRSHDPLTWAERFRNELQAKQQAWPRSSRVV